MKLIYSLLFLIMFIGLASAEIYRLDTNITIVQTCANCTYMNFTSITLPNSTVVQFDLNMTRNGPKFIQYYFVDKVGKYVVTICGDVNGILTCNDYDFTVTPSGDELSPGQGMLYLGVFIVSLFIFFLALYGAINIPWTNERDEEGYILNVSKLKYVKIFLMVFSYTIGILITFLLYNITWGYFNFNVASNIFYVFYWLLISLFFPIIVVALLMVVIMFVNDSKLHEAIQRGIPIQ